MLFSNECVNNSSHYLQGFQILNLSCRKRLFTVLNKELPYSLDIEIKNPINDGVSTSLDIGLFPKNLTQTVSFRYSSLEKCEKEISKITLNR